MAHTEYLLFSFNRTDRRSNSFIPYSLTNCLTETFLGWLEHSLPANVGPLSILSHRLPQNRQFIPPTSSLSSTISPPCSWLPLCHSSCPSIVSSSYKVACLAPFQTFCLLYHVLDLCSFSYFFMPYPVRSDTCNSQSSLHRSLCYSKLVF